jgi:hypothetical protein
VKGVVPLAATATTTDLGKYQVEISGDPPTLRTGTNTLTIAISNFPVDAPLTLNAVGPAGQVVNVPLKPLTILTGPEDDMSGMEGMADMPGMSHSSSHDAPAATQDAHSSGHAAQPATQDAHSSGHAAAAPAAPAPAASSHEHATASYNVRGKVAINQSGTWKLVLEGKDEHGAAIKAEAAVNAEYGGPNRVYLGFTGLLMFGSIAYGAVNRRRQPAGGR